MRPIWTLRYGLSSAPLGAWASKSKDEEAASSARGVRCEMRQTGKKYRKSAAERERKLYPLTDAVALVKKIAYAKFNETVEISILLGVDPKHADQMVRGTVVLPKGLGRSKRVIAITSGDKVKEAREAGADEVGGDDIVERIAGGWIDFDAVVATPD